MLKPFHSETLRFQTTTTNTIVPAEIRGYPRNPEVPGKVLYLHLPSSDFNSTNLPCHAMEINRSFENYRPEN